ncbi:MAG: hypothetical protein HC933_02925 [Pleurocapsa sp. SU_196_0]|nr:hypothetical protein [Pleurocapsa sp. SU_196_0]
MIAIHLARFGGRAPRADLMACSAATVERSGVLLRSGDLRRVLNTLRVAGCLTCDPGPQRPCRLVAPLADVAGRLEARLWHCLEAGDVGVARADWWLEYRGDDA